MSIQEQLIKEIKELPVDAQKKVLKLVHFVKEEILPLQKEKAKIKGKLKGVDAFADVDRLAIETGISDLSTQHDHYLYGVPKR